MFLLFKADDYRYPSYGSYDTGDPSTTNLYLGNLNPKVKLNFVSSELYA